MDEAVSADRLMMTADIVSAYVSNNSVPAAELPALLGQVHSALARLSAAPTTSEPEAEKATPAQVKKSITPDALISFEDGKSYKTLRRHLTLRGLSPEAYRAKWGLPSDYPMTSAKYSEQRSQLARELGLGQQRHRHEAPAVAAVPESAAPAKPRGRRKAAEAASA